MSINEMASLTQLTEIECELLRALGTGACNKHIAQAMFKSEQTVRNQLSVLFKKINVKNRTQAACWCLANTEICLGVIGTSVLLRAQRTSANNALQINVEDIEQGQADAEIKQIGYERKMFSWCLNHQPSTEIKAEKNRANK
jgi:DNA-binding CsgD family transcriptional regulator